MKNGKFDLKTFLNNIELYLATLCFIVLTVMLTLQVFSRFILHHSWTWMEEFATIMFVWMIYLAISAAVTYRKHLRMEEACRLIRETNDKFYLIGSKVGYPDAVSFARVFKEEMGCTPSEYRSMHASGEES